MPRKVLSFSRGLQPMGDSFKMLGALCEPVLKVAFFPYYVAYTDFLVRRIFHLRSPAKILQNFCAFLGI